MTAIDHALPVDAAAATEIDIAIGGMTCGACSARLERVLNGIDGVSASVNLATERASLTLSDPATAEQAIEAVNAAGYTARQITPNSIEVDSDYADLLNRKKWLWRRLLVALALFMPLCDATIAFSLIPSTRFDGWPWAMLALAAPVVTWCAWPFYVAATRAARHGTTTMDTLVSIGIVAATLWSIAAMFAYGSATRMIYFDVPAGVVLFLLIGRYFELRSRIRAGTQLRTLLSLNPKQAALIDAQGIETQVDAATLTPGDIFAVRPGDTVSADGVVSSGSIELDAAAMTGESQPQTATTGMHVWAGARCLDGAATIRTTSGGSHTQLSRMIDLVVKAQNEKAGLQRIADRIAAIFVPIVLTIAVLTGAAWWVFGTSTEQAVNAALSVLIVACPCALGLATPTALLVASGTAARMGIFFKGHRAIERSRSINEVIFDKTGTLTTGAPSCYRRDRDKRPHIRRGSWSGGSRRADVEPPGRACYPARSTATYRSTEHA